MHLIGVPEIEEREWNRKIFEDIMAENVLYLKSYIIIIYETK